MGIYNVSDMELDEAFIDDLEYDMNVDPSAKLCGIEVNLHQGENQQREAK